MNHKFHVPYCEFYITHVCNLSCMGCNRFNNNYFRGWQKWKDYEPVYKEWSHQLTFGNVAIMGGEPLLNPNFLEWTNGISNLWPKTFIRVITNGYRLLHVDGLYNLVRDNKRIQLWVSIHNKIHKKTIIGFVNDFLKTPIKIRFNGTIPYQEKLYFTDANDVTVVVEYNWWFHQGAMIKTDNGSTLHQSDPDKAHNICHMKTCHTFFKGKLYKCGVVAVLPDYDEQFKLELTQEDRDLLYSYTPLSVEDQFDQKKLFIESLPDMIAQCKFCPESYNGQQIWSQEKKLTFHQKVK